MIFSGEDEEWSDSEKTPSVNSGVEGGGSSLPSPGTTATEEESNSTSRLTGPVSQLAIGSASSANDIRIRLGVLAEDARKRGVGLPDDTEVYSFFLPLFYIQPNFYGLHFSKLKIT